MKKLILGLLISNLLNLTHCSTIQYGCTGVIGVSYDWWEDGLVDYALSGSPGEKLGITTGDKLENIDELVGEPGDEVIVKWVTKDGLAKEAKTKLICYNDLVEIQKKQAQEHNPGFDIKEKR